jgi:uncharacterized membrane protein YczE
MSKKATVSVLTPMVRESLRRRLLWMFIIALFIDRLLVMWIDPSSFLSYLFLGVAEGLIAIVLSDKMTPSLLLRKTK